MSWLGCPSLEFVRRTISSTCGFDPYPPRSTRRNSRACALEGEKCFVQPVTATVYSMTGKKPPEYNPAARDGPPDSLLLISGSLEFFVFRFGGVG